MLIILLIYVTINVKAYTQVTTIDKAKSLELLNDLDKSDLIDMSEWEFDDARHVSSTVN
jgi:hypothetical protein